ncbi:MAG: FlgD immunoglobulin-like domain containing protein [Candidatus Krumholzibacteriia bacterium]
MAVLLLATALLPARVQALRVATWNILNYPSAQGNSREDDFRVVLTVIDPDLLVVQEITSTPGATEFLNDVLNVIHPGEWALAPFVPDFTARACYYRTAKLDFLSSIVLTTTLRDINGFVFRPDGYSSSAAEFRIYTLHLKASQGASNESRRLAEAQVLRAHLNALPSTTHFLVGGDYNIYNSGEPAWAELTGSQADNDGRLFDPINQIGTWHNSAFFAAVHTQSTRTTELGDGGSIGGMDDRFDMMLASDDMLDGEGTDYVSGSYVACGQDGQHFNSAINAPPPNAAVSSAVASALHTASDHLPVYIDIQLPAKMVVSGNLDFGTVITGGPGIALSIQNTATPPADDLDYSLSAGTGFVVPSGSFSLAAGGSDAPAVSISTAPGTYAASVTVSGDAPDNPTQIIPATGTVLDHAQPSTSATSSSTTGTVLFGSHAQGAFTDQPAEAHNFGFDPGQALLEVHGFAMTGTDAARFSLVSFTPATVGSTPATYMVHFDDAGASPNTTYLATLTLSTRDQQDLPGASDLAGLEWTLVATVTDTIPTDAPDRVVRATWLHPNVPNPFNPATTLAFDLAHAGHVELAIFTIQGRRVRTLVSRVLETGNHRVVWDGTDAAGTPIASGVYLYRLRADGMQQTRRMTLLR